MATRNISLTAEQDAFVEKIVEDGEYQNASEAIRDALRALQQRRRKDALKLKALRMEVKAGFEAFARGKFTDIAYSDLGRHLESGPTLRRADGAVSLFAAGRVRSYANSGAQHWDRIDSLPTARAPYAATLARN